MKKRTFIRVFTVVTILTVVGALLAMYFLFHTDIFLAAGVALVMLINILVLYFSVDSLRIESSREIESSLDAVNSQLYKDGDLGILMFDENYEITYQSELFRNRDINHYGEKLLNWLPELQDMLDNESAAETVVINDEKYLVRRIERSNVLTFKDITAEYDLVRRIDDDAYVLGLLSYDNYDESNISEDDLSFINSNIKIPVMDYFKNFGVVTKTLRNGRVLLLLNEKIFSQILNDRFSILNTVRRVSKDSNLGVTLSLAFARGSESYSELDKNVQSLLELAQTRGGDQVVVRKTGEDATFYGGTSEAREKESKTKVRVTANTVKDLIDKSVNVIIVGHRDMDADCLAASLCMSNIAMSMEKPTYIVTRSGGVESMIGDVMKKFSRVLEEKHHFISENEAMDVLNDDSLVIMVDHHSAAQSNSPNLLRQAGRIIIIDHHRRQADLDVVPLMVYLEASASSACEITSEFLPYFGKNINITPEEANIMYLGLLIDTDRFRVRTGSRTFDVAKQLRRYGADPILCDELSQEPYDNIIQRSRIIDAGKAYKNDIIVSALYEGRYPRSIASQACDTMVKAREIEAAFVICMTDRDETIISARSKGKINVQVIMERMHGGGHMTAAGLQVSDVSVAKLEAELYQTLDEYFEGDGNESNTAE
ncbi:MAG: DHH family phosphoesterase [Erysipelotrichaceae bacterium]|nr:DHH family phosphoesterase [Erysipelotrichaceae bacterium]